MIKYKQKVNTVKYKRCYDMITPHVKRVNGFPDRYDDLARYQKVFIRGLVMATQEWSIVYPDGTVLYLHPHLHHEPSSKGV